MGVHRCEPPHHGHAVVGEGKAVGGGTRGSIFGSAGDLLASLHRPQGTCLCWSKPGRGAGTSQGTAEPKGPMMGGQWLMPSTAQAAGEQSTHYKYISGVNAREEKKS